MATDETAGLVRGVEVTTANMHDAAELEAVLPPEPGEREPPELRKLDAVQVQTPVVDLSIRLERQAAAVMAAIPDGDLDGTDPVDLRAMGGGLGRHPTFLHQPFYSGQSPTT